MSSFTLLHFVDSSYCRMYPASYCRMYPINI